MRNWVVFFGIAAVLLASLPAVAQEQGGRRLGQGGPVRQAPPQRVPARDANPPNRDANRNPHMTPEQRRQLRRDVHDHGRDIYRERAGRNRR